MMPAYQIAFILEQALGHITHAQNLRAFYAADPTLKPHWILPEWKRSGLASRVPVYRSNWTLQAGWQARSALSGLSRRVKLDGLFFHTQVPAVLSSDWVKKLPSVISLDATPLQYDSLGEAYQHQAGPNWLERVKFGLNRRCFLAARHLVTWSQWARQGLVDEYGIPEDRVTVIPPGVNTCAWQRPQSWPRHQRVVRILFVGGDLERKGGLDLLEAFHYLRSTLRDPCTLELHLVTASRVSDQPGVFAHQGLQPNSPEIRAMYFNADIFCLPTHGDCLPMALAEAGAAGLPLVSTRVAAIPEIVEPGKGGFLVQPRDVKGLVDALGELVRSHSLRARMGAHSREIVLRDHDSEKNAGQLLQILKGVIDQERHVTRR